MGFEYSIWQYLRYKKSSILYIEWESERPYLYKYNKRLSALIVTSWKGNAWSQSCWLEISLALVTPNLYTNIFCLRWYLWNKDCK